MTVSKKVGKPAQLRILGGEEEIDMTLVEGLKDPLQHMIRNSVDHGFETPSVRRGLGKPELGTVTLEAARESGYFVLRVSDDGGGLPRAKLAKKANELGISCTAENITDEQLAKVIFSAGVSTAEQVTDISGRGVGMDVVRDKIESLRGSISLSSEEGVGTTFEIRIPLALAIISGFRFMVGEQNFVIPAAEVVECMDAKDDATLNSDGDRLLLNVRGTPMPCLDLEQAFRLPCEPTERRSVLVVQHNSGPVALRVGRLMGEEQTVVKPLGAFFQSIDSVAGSTVLGTGHVALLLDVRSLVSGVVNVNTTNPN